MKGLPRPRIALSVLLAAIGTSTSLAAPATTQSSRDRQPAWQGLHVMGLTPADVPDFKRTIRDVLAPMGINVIVLEVDYQYEYQSHPELRASGALSKADARTLASHCREHGVKLIPQLQCLGHQSWAGANGPMLAKHPEFDETPHIPKDNTGIYCRSWCPLHPKVNPIIFDLMDELIDAFQAEAFHVGMDEVFLIADERCPRCKGKDPARLFAKAVNDYHRHLVGEKRLTMLMWGDRLIDDRLMLYGKWEASANGTAPAIDLIPKDIIICDWHYGLRDDYPSVPHFQEKGFRVWPASWHNIEATRALAKCAKAHATDRMMGHLFTTWVRAAEIIDVLLDRPESASAEAVAAVAALRACMATPSRRE